MKICCIEAKLQKMLLKLARLGQCYRGLHAHGHLKDLASECTYDTFRYLDLAWATLMVYICSHFRDEMDLK